MAPSNYSPLGALPFGEPGLLEAEDRDGNATAPDEKRDKERIEEDSEQVPEDGEYDSDAGMDAEVEGLLAYRRVEEARPAAGEDSMSKVRSADVGSGSARKTTWGLWLGRGGGGMTTSERSLFAKEMLSQILPSMILSLIGAILTGLLLEKLQTWRVFIRIEELFILVPILLNLKGNLEMNLAARFSTSANIGELDLRLTRRSLIFGNMALLQVQALIVALISGLLSFGLGMLARNGVHHGLQHPIHNPGTQDNAAAGGTEVTDALRGGYFEALMVICVSMLAASFSSAILGSFMCSLVVLCRRYKINPDNIATPMASALGDLLTLVILGLLSSLFAKFLGAVPVFVRCESERTGLIVPSPTGTLVSTAVFLLLLAAVAVNVVITFRNAYVQELLTIGWSPLFAAMAIASASGLVLEAYVNEFEGFALFAAVLTALSGNAGSVYVSRISTALHSSSTEHYLIVSLTLFAITSPVLFAFLLFVWITGQAPVSFAFAIAFAGVVCVQVALALVLGYFITLLLWKWDYDPDGEAPSQIFSTQSAHLTGFVTVYALPLLSSFLDVTGQLMLVASFIIARRFAGTTEILESGVDLLKDTMS
ncbi:solute carrier family 41, partial [Phenoliferia sp. Uapishka_3]